MLDNDKEALQEEVQALKNRVQKLETAFIKDEDSELDYAGHKAFHRKQIADEAGYNASKSKILVDILSWVFIGILTIIGSALFHTYILPAKVLVK